jgi:hypothetical protein
MDSQQVSSDLMSMKECSPMMVFAIYVIVSGITLYMTRNNLKKLNDDMIDNLYSLYSWNEIKYILVMGVVLYGLCQYKQDTLAWVSLSVPLFYLVFKNMYIYSYIFNAQQIEPPPVPVKKESKEREVTQNFVKQQQEIQKAQAQQQHLQQQKLQQQMQQNYAPPVNKEIGGLSPPLNSYDPSNGSLAMF